MSPSSRKLVLKSSDGELFEIEEAEAQQSLLIKHMMEDDCAETCISIPNVTGDILSRVIVYCRKHVNIAADDDALRSFDSEFINVDEATLFHLATAASFLDIKNLSDLLWGTLADRRSKRRTARELRRRVTETTQTSSSDCLP
ncbi:hypothetical protein L1887_24285 [Cichorium endivia]|nr:hypothetical protein L1887_24285 [Cichorium endivia]